MADLILRGVDPAAMPAYLSTAARLAEDWLALRPADRRVGNNSSVVFTTQVAGQRKAVVVYGTRAGTIIVRFFDDGGGSDG